MRGQRIGMNRASPSSLVQALTVVQSRPHDTPAVDRHLDVSQPQPIVTRAYIVSRTLTNSGARARDVGRFRRHGSQHGTRSMYLESQYPA